MAAAPSLNTAVLGFLASVPYPKTRKAFVKEAALTEVDPKEADAAVLTAAFEAHIAGRPGKRQRVEAQKEDSSSDSSTTDDSDSDSSDSEDEAKPAPEAASKRTSHAPAVAAAAARNGKASHKASVAEKSGENEVEEDSKEAKPLAATPSGPAAAAASDSDSSSSSPSDDDDDDSSSDDDSSDPSDSDDSDDDDEDAEKEAKAAAQHLPAPASAAAGNSGKFSGKSPGAGKPFQRVDESRWHTLNDHTLLVDNSYKTAFGEAGWGHRASEKLLTVRGKDFRHEKTKKKRGGYRGGAIDSFAVNSVKL